jgi:hypothetical protein
VTELSKAQIRAQVEHAFRGVPRLPAEDIVLEEYRHNIDAQEMAGAFGGRFWTQLSLEELFFHRESIFMFSSAGYLSYLPAYMVGCLRDDMELVPDISRYLVSGLRSQRKRRTTQQRLELFDEEQRAALAAVLGHVAESLDDLRVEGFSPIGLDAVARDAHHS